MDVAVAVADNGSDMVVTVAVLCSIKEPPILPIHARVTLPPCHDASIGPGHIGQMRFRPANTRTILDRIEDITPYCRTVGLLIGLFTSLRCEHGSEFLRKDSVFKDHWQT